MTDREKLIELIREADSKIFKAVKSRQISHPFEAFEIEADHLIANDVTVRERGRWVDAYGIRKSKCTSCGVAFGRVMDADCYYCPNCGADMRPMEEANV